MDIFHSPRKSHLEIGKIYFWTATINGWKKLLHEDPFKQIIIDSFKFLTEKKLVTIFGFVVMPNHIHLIWRLDQMNGKELPSASLLKFTAHQFKKMLTPGDLKMYSVEKENKQFEFWQRDSLAVDLYSKEVAHQKLDYIHLNPLADHWNLAKVPINYTFSSASFYELEDKRFSFLHHLEDVF